MVALTEPRHGLAGLHPGNFALVMATAILAQNLRVQGLPRLAIALAAFAAIAYVLLLVLSLLRVFLAPRAVGQDLLDPALVFGFFTLVAATDLLGVLAMQAGLPLLAKALWA